MKQEDKKTKKNNGSHLGKCTNLEMYNFLYELVM